MNTSQVIIPAYVTGPSYLSVQWLSVEEPGYQTIEGMPYLDSGQLVSYEVIKNLIGFKLVEKRKVVVIFMVWMYTYM